jgi:hypothetical protein
VTLATVQDASLATASADAKAIRRAAQERAAAIIDQARAEAAALIAARRAAAARLADLEARERLAEARGEARAIVLRAQRSVLVGARSAVHAAARRLVDDSRYDRLIERLAVEARERLAPAGPVQIVRLAQGGLVARAGSREIDYSLGAQVDRWLEAMASELERLWQ